MSLWRRIALGLPAGLVALGLAGLAFQDARPFTPDQIAARSAALFRYGAVEVPHGLMPDSLPEAALFARVAQDGPLDASESATYRAAYQGLLLSRQRLFRLLDDDLCLATDHGAGVANNIGGAGIAGLHDLHAASALANFTELDAALRQLPDAGASGRIAAAMRAYKDLTDLMVHLAPATHSVILITDPPLPDGADPDLAQAFAAFRQAMTDAGFAPVGGELYRIHIDRGVAAYAALAGMVQARVTAALSPLEQRIAGRWLAVQQVQPRLTLP